MQLIAVFTDNYRIVFITTSTCGQANAQQMEMTLNNTIHEKYDFYTQ